MTPFDVAYALGAVVFSPLWARKSRAGWGERLGKIAPLPVPPAGKRRLLLHAVSVGEVNALRQLVPMLRARCEVVVAAHTDTGLARARELFAAGGPVVRYPLDFSWAVDRFLDAVRPDAVGLVELEVWPNFVGRCARRGIPVGVINGRLSERSFRGYRRVRPILAPTFARLSLAAVQNDAYAQRFIALGVSSERVVVTDSMKWDGAVIADDAPGSAELAASLGIDRERPLIVAGSTGPGEEALLHEACPQGVQLLCAPRKPERFDEAADAMPGCTRRSVVRARAQQAGVVASIARQRVGTGRAGLASSSAKDRFLLDSLGELRAAYALADVVVIGRSFGKLYGSDPVEPIGLGKPTLIGPAHRDFQHTVEALRGAGGIMVVNPGELRVVLESLVRDTARGRELARRGRACIVAHQGATPRHAALLLKLLQPTPPAGG